MVIFMAIIIAVVLTTNAFSEDNTCYLQSTTAELNILVYDVLPSQTIGKLIWEGVLKGEQKILLKSNFGRFFYEYSTNPEAYTSMVRGFVRPCKDGETVLVP
jgi:hypothetical protein